MGLGVSIGMALVMAIGRMIIPIAIQQILDKGIDDGNLNWSFVLTTCAIAAIAMVAFAVLLRRLWSNVSCRTATRLIRWLSGSPTRCGFGIFRSLVRANPGATPAYQCCQRSAPFSRRPDRLLAQLERC